MPNWKPLTLKNRCEQWEHRRGMSRNSVIKNIIETHRRWSYTEKNECFKDFWTTCLNFYLESLSHAHDR